MRLCEYTFAYVHVSESRQNTHALAHSGHIIASDSHTSCLMTHIHIHRKHYEMT